MSHFSWDWRVAWLALPHLFAGLRFTVEATIFGAILAVAMGFCWALIRLGDFPVITPVVDLFVEFLRGTPFLVQLYFLFYVFPTYGITLSAMATGILGLGLYYSAYAAEVFRAGIEMIPAGQWEASLTLGLPLQRVWARIILPQVLRTVTPMLGNYVIVMFKESALLSTITVMEVLAQATNVGFQQFRFVEPLTLAGWLYFLLSYPTARLFRAVEARLPTHG
jgi:polar amino acid transport system permease protein